MAEGRSGIVWHARSSQSKALIVVIPGAANNRSLYLIGLPILLDSGYDAILMDYEGFGDSPGRATLQHAAYDALAVAGYAITQHRRADPCGMSLGSSLAARVAAQYEVDTVAMDGVLMLRDEISDWVHKPGIGHACRGQPVGRSGA